MRMPMSFIFKKNILPMLRVQKSKRAGFTLLELIGVMVVISILLAVALPSTIDLIQVQRSVNERAELPKIAEALKRGMLREQLFPIYENDASKATDGSEASDAYWWNLAARHGGGSANEVRYPLGVRPGSDNTRHLYLADASWSGSTFFDIVSGNQLNWIQDPRDPSELRLLLLSTTSSGLPLPNTLTQVQFDNLWNDWAVGSDGNPMPDEDGNEIDYGLNVGDWTGRAVELNVERIDLREWLCTVVIENRRAIEEAGGQGFPGNSKDWVRGSVYAYTENVVGAEVILQTSDVNDGQDPPSFYTRVDGVVLTKRGIILDADVDDENPPLILVKGNTVGVNEESGEPTITSDQVRINLNLTNLAPLELIKASDTDVTEDLNPTDVTVYSESFYFLYGQELLLGQPWLMTDEMGNTYYPEIGIFTIIEPFSTLRFDGLQWHY